MLNRLTIFNKMLVLIAAILAAVLLFYNYTNNVSSRVLQKELIQSNINRLTYFLGQIDIATEQLWVTGFVLLKDPDVLLLQEESILSDSYERIRVRNAISNRLQVMSNTLTLANDITVYSPITGLRVSTMQDDIPQAGRDLTPHSSRWTYHPGGNGSGRFVTKFTRPFGNSVAGAEEGNAPAALIVETDIKQQSLSLMLDQLKVGTAGEPFLYKPGLEPIAGSDITMDKIQLFKKLASNIKLKDLGHEMMTSDGHSYLINYAKSDSLQWYVIDMIPLERVMEPIRKAKAGFYFMVILLLLLGLLSIMVLYRNVRLPILHLVRGVQRVKKGDYGYRIRKDTDPDFVFLFNEFNQMSAEIQRLIETVYFEQIKVREATLSQLQSQINPHFLYNNFAFIQSMARLDNTKAIIAFTRHLSRYYRSTTRPALTESVLANELELVRTYLSIHAMQSPRLKWDIVIPDEAMTLPVPPLILQPIVENAIVHGIENKLGEGAVLITGTFIGSTLLLCVEDNGNGLSPQEISELQKKLSLPLMEETGCGLWNVDHRLLHLYGNESRLAFSHSELGGLKVSMRIQYPAAGQEEA